MYIKDIINLLRTELPKSSDKFSEKVAISTLTYAAGVVTVVTGSAHGLETGDVCTIVGAKQKTPISSIVTTDDIATVTTSIAHDQTLDYESSDDQPQVVIGGTNIAAYNDSWDLQTVPNRKTFTFEITGDPLPANTGYLIENSVGGFSGIKTVTKIDTTSFSFTTDKSLASEGLDGYVHRDIRITGGVSLDICKQAYSKQLINDWWGFVVPGDSSASKSRQTINDSVYSPTKGDEYRQKIISSFDFYIIIPSKTDIAGRRSFDQAIEESTAIFKSLLGYALPNPYTIDDFSRIILETHGPEEFTGAWYIHRFTFNITDELVIDDINTTSEDVAFRDIEMDVLNSFDTITINDTFKLDEE